MRLSICSPNRGIMLVQHFDVGLGTTSETSVSLSCSLEPPETFLKLLRLTEDWVTAMRLLPEPVQVCFPHRAEDARRAVEPSRMYVPLLLQPRAHPAVFSLDRAVRKYVGSVRNSRASSLWPIPDLRALSISLFVPGVRRKRWNCSLQWRCWLEEK